MRCGAQTQQQRDGDSGLIFSSWMTPGGYDVCVGDTRVVGVWGAFWGVVIDFAQLGGGWCELEPTRVFDANLTR